MNVNIIIECNLFTIPECKSRYTVLYTVCAKKDANKYEAIKY